MTTWKNLHEQEFKKAYFVQIQSFIAEEIKAGEVIYPHSLNFYKAFDLTPFKDVKVIMLGQDPYHGPAQAQGLSFSVPEGVRTPPSLRNIYKELAASTDFTVPPHGNLEVWAQQGVLMMNSCLTVRAKSPGSHSNKGWEIFTDAMIKALSNKKEHLVFLLWGKFAQSKQSLIDNQKHLILTTSHPSPFSAHKGFLGCDHFNLTNQYLTDNRIQPINWDL